MQVEQLEIPREEAMREYEAYREVLKKAQFDHEQYLKDLKKIYGHMRHGRSIIDLWASMKKAGIRKNGNPKLAICRADSKRCRFRKFKNNGGMFYWLKSDRWGGEWVHDIEIPEGTFKGWHQTTQTRQYTDKNNQIQTWEETQITERDIETVVPIIPAKFLNVLRGSLKNYHILWEVKKWKPVPPIDPILLRKLTPNMFVVLATWDLSPLERAVIKGRL